jgi:hypothetical protein
MIIGTSTRVSICLASSALSSPRSGLPGAKDFTGSLWGWGNVNMLLVILILFDLIL